MIIVANLLKESVTYLIKIVSINFMHLLIFFSILRLFFYFLIQNDAPPVWSTVCGYMEINEKKIEKKEQALFMEMYT